MGWLESLRPIAHLGLHFLVPLAIAWVAFKPRWRRVFLILIATMLVDLDHLLADPIYDPDRCSIGFHPLHTYWAIAGYALLALVTPFRLVALGILVHMGLDVADCVWQRTN